MRHSENSSTRPIAQATRGKTVRNRLRRVDNFLIRYDRKLIIRQDDAYQNAWFIDLGNSAEALVKKGYQIDTRK